MFAFTIPEEFRKHFPSDSELVREFNRAAGQPIPTKPTPMNKEEVFFLIKMMLDEVMELAATVSNSDEYKDNMIKMIKESRDYNIDFKNLTSEEITAEQADAVVDCYYHALNSAIKKGINISKIFRVVHDANMKKKDPSTNLFLKREDGKIIKPPNWIPPNIVNEIKKQIKNGSF